MSDQKTNEERLAVLEVGQAGIYSGLIEMKETMNKRFDRFDDLLQGYIRESSDVQNTVGSLETLVKKHEETLYDPKDGLTYRVVNLESFYSTLTKVIWEVARPGLLMMGVLVFVGIGILAALIYQLSFVLHAIP